MEASALKSLLVCMVNGESLTEGDPEVTSSSRFGDIAVEFLPVHLLFSTDVGVLAMSHESRCCSAANDAGHD